MGCEGVRRSDTSSASAPLIVRHEELELACDEVEVAACARQNHRARQADRVPAGRADAEFPQQLAYVRRRLEPRREGHFFACLAEIEEMAGLERGLWLDDVRRLFAEVMCDQFLDWEAAHVVGENPKRTIGGAISHAGIQKRRLELTTRSIVLAHALEVLDEHVGAILVSLRERVGGFDLDRHLAVGGVGVARERESRGAEGILGVRAERDSKLHRSAQVLCSKRVDVGAG